VKALVAVVATLLAVTTPVLAQATWNGPTGAVLNPLPLTLEKGDFNTAAHYLNLNPANGMGTYSAAYGLMDNLEIGYTFADLAIGSHHGDPAYEVGTAQLDDTGDVQTNIIHAKYRFLEEGKWPAIAIGGVWYDSDDESTVDIYLTAMKTFEAHVPITAAVTLRSTEGSLTELLGVPGDRSFQWGGYLGVQVDPKLALGAEYYGQPRACAALDLFARWSIADDLTLDVALARLNRTYDNQLMAGITKVW